MTEQKIIKALFVDCVQGKGHPYFCSNTQALNGHGESDCVSINKNEMVTEFEVKISRSDFKAEFRNKEYKHNLLAGNPVVIKFLYDHEIYKRIGEEKGIRKPDCNYFYFVCPDGLLQEKDVPAYAGLIWVKFACSFEDRNLYHVTYIKRAPRLKKEKARSKLLGLLYRSVMYKYYTALR